MSKRFEDPKLGDISNQMLPGAIALIILLIFYTHKLEAGIFFTWLIENAVSFIIAALFIRIVANTIVNRRFNSENYKPLAVGIILFIPYSIYTSMTVESVILVFLEAIVFLSFYTVIVNIVKEAID